MPPSPMPRTVSWAWAVHRETHSLSGDRGSSVAEYHDNRLLNRLGSMAARTIKRTTASEPTTTDRPSSPRPFRHSGARAATATRPAPTTNPARPPEIHTPPPAASVDSARPALLLLRAASTAPRAIARASTARAPNLPEETNVPEGR